MAESGMLLNPEEVEFLLDSGATAKTGDCDIAQEVTMRGDLDQISLADIFQTLAMAKMEGLLRIRNPLEQRMLHFHDGFVRILVPNRVVVRRLGQRLVHAGLLQPDALRLALLEQRRCELPIGQILVHQGHVTQDQVEQVVTQQVTEELFGLFTWRHGTFEFFKGSISDPTLQERFDKCVEYEVNSLLLEVARRTDEWEVIAEALVSLDEIPGRNPDAPQSTAGLSEQHQILLEAVDGRLSYRELAEQSMMPLFDTARAARDLVHQGLIRNQPDPSMIEAARHHIELGNQKRALMVVQALRDRNREHEPAVLMAMAEVLRQCGESRSASAMLLQVARASSDPAEALELARQARTASDRDPEVLSFLRECMLRAGTATPQELEATTLALLDELIDRSDSEGALQILEECEQADQAGPQMLARKARIQQRHKDIPGAVATLMRIAELYSAVGNRSRMVEAYELILKLDRSRRDIAKLLKKMRSTRAARIARAAVLLAIVLMVAGGSTVMMQRQQREQQMLEGSTRIAQLLRANDRIGARQALQALREAVGDRPELEDLQRQLQFADASEVNARRRSERRAAMERMAEAAELLTAGALRDSLVIYSELAQSPQLQTEVREVVETRLEAARAELETLAKILAVDLPLPPTPVPDRRLLHDGLQLLRTRFQPQKLRLASAMLELNTNNSAPALVSAEQADRLVKTAAQAQPLLQRAQERIRQYEEALARVDADRRLEPLFRAALEHERQYDFRAALEAYRRLKREHGDGPMTTHFRDLIERYAGIMRYMDAIAQATDAGDFATAQSQYRAVRLSYPDIPFERLARLPLRVETRPPGATVTWNDTDVGRTPLLLSFLPGVPGAVDVRLDGFRPEQAQIRGDRVGELDLVLARLPLWEIELEGIVEQPCAFDGGSMYAVDRSGNVTAINLTDGRPLWQWQSGDLSGLLSAPLRNGRLLVVASVDGSLRALEAASGRVVWTRENCGSEVAPALTQDILAVATTDRRLLLLDADNGAPLHTITLPGRPATDLVVHGRTVLVATIDGDLLAADMGNGKTLWRQRLDRASGLRTSAIQPGFAVIGDSGVMTALSPTTGQSLWRVNLDGMPEGPPTSNGRHLAVAFAQRLLLLDPTNGSIRLQCPSSGEPWAGPVTFQENCLLAPRRDGTIRALSLEKLETLYQLRPEAALQARSVTVVGRSIAAGTRSRKLLLYRHP